MSFNKIKNSWENVPAKIADAIGQTVFVLIFSFAPMLALSIRRYFDLENSPISSNFADYFGKGEICFFILSVIGAILWSVVTRKYPKFIKATLLSLIALIMIFTLIYVGDNNFPDEEIAEGSIKFLWFLYIVTLTLWFFSLFGEVDAKNNTNAKNQLKKQSEIQELINKARMSDG